MRSPIIAVFCVAIGTSLACAGAQEAPEAPSDLATPTGPAPRDAPPKEEKVEKDAPLLDAWMVITATHTSKADSEAAFPEGATWPGQMWDTSKIDGLKPGLWLRSPLITLQQSIAEKGVSHYRADFPDAYVRKVQLPEYCDSASSDCEYQPDVANHAVDCSGELPPADCTLGDGSWRVIVAFDFRPADAPTEDWSWTSSAVVQKDGMGGVRTVWADQAVVELPGQAGKTLDIRTVTKEDHGYVFVGSDTPPTYDGQSMAWTDTFSAASQAFGVNLLAGYE